MKREKTLEFVMSFPGWWKGNFFWKRLGIYILWNGTYYEKELKYVLLKMCTCFHKYLWALKKSLEIWYA
jgi:hypothetical protein